MGDVVLELDLGLDIGPGLVPHHRVGLLEVGVTDRHGALRPGRVGHRPQHRVALADEQPTAWAQQGRHRLGPVADPRQPAQRPDAGIDQVEASGAKRGHRPVDRRLDIVDLGARLGGQGPRLVEGCG